MNRPRLPETLTCIAAVALLVSLFLSWYSVDAYNAGGAHTSGWGAVGPVIAVVLGIAITLALALVATTLTRRSPALPVALGVITWVFGAIAWSVLALRLLDEPGLGIGLGPAQVTLRWPGYVGFAAMTLIPIAALWTLRDERTDAPESAYDPPPARPIPDTGDDSVPPVTS
ncbi:MAG: hypothetical protein V9E83_05720 [Baekduia sp.]